MSTKTKIQNELSALIGKRVSVQICPAEPYSLSASFNGPLALQDGMSYYSVTLVSETGDTACVVFTHEWVTSVTNVRGPVIKLRLAKEGGK